jgi:N6-L-threonylcarbamoyladenine synthase
LRVLAIESSCDETAAAVLDDAKGLLSNIVSTQIDIHRPFGGVVPELASRHHLQNIVPVVQCALDEAELRLEELDGLAVTRGPGLVGALLIGAQFAKSLAFVSGLPLIGVNHLEGHLYSSRLSLDSVPPAIPTRHLALLVSGGHTALILVEGFGQYRLLGQTRDDAAGEAFDKVAKLLGLGYPGGPIVEEMARTGDCRAIRFPRPMAHAKGFDFSFSGLKTAVANHVRREGLPVGQRVNDLCASFQQAVVDVLIAKALSAARKERVSAIVAAGGVLANGSIRSALQQATQAESLELHIPPLKFCTDNAAMIAAAAMPHLRAGRNDGQSILVSARLPLAA